MSRASKKTSDAVNGLRNGVRSELLANARLHTDVAVARLETTARELRAFSDDEMAQEIADDVVDEFGKDMDQDEYDLEEFVDEFTIAEDAAEELDGVVPTWQEEVELAQKARERAAKRRKRNELYVALRPESNGVQKVVSLSDRFKRWLGVRPGEQQRVLEDEVRDEQPEWSDRRVEREARVRLQKMEEDKKAVHEREVNDDKIVRILMRAHLRADDKEALALLREFEEQRVRDESGRDKREVERRMCEFDTALQACREEVRRVGGQTAEEAAAVMMDRMRSLQAATSDGEQRAAALGKSLSASMGVNVNDLVQSANAFVGEYVAELADDPDDVCRAHVESLAKDLLAAVSQTARLVQVAPPDAVFFTNQELETGDDDDDEGSEERRSARSGLSYAHPIDAMCAMLERSSAHEIDGGAPLDAAALTRYMHQWRRVQNESQMDIDRELANIYRVQEFDALREALHKIGVSDEQAESVLTCGVNSRHSAVVSAMVAFIESERFEEAREAARQISRSAMTAKERRERRDAVADDDDDVSAGEEKSAHPMAAWAARAALSLPICTRNYLRDYLRAPHPSDEYLELPCLNGQRCICLRLNESFPPLGTAAQRSGGADETGARTRPGFVCRQFLLPEQQRALYSTGQQPPHRQLCLLCNRRTTTKLFYERQRQRDILPEREAGIELLQNHSVLTDSAGEYDLSACLTTTFDEVHMTGICKPFVAYNAAHYRHATTVVHGTRLPCLIESDVLDFRPRSASKPPI